MNVKEVEIEINVNGKDYIEKIESRMLLVHFLRETLGLTGTHIGCDTTNCGACTVLMNGRPVKSCTVLAVQANKSHITTIEGLSGNGEMHPIQKAFLDKHGLQCGFCTPGMVMSTYALLSSVQNPGEEEIRKALAGNLCRCTGYEGIVQAVREAARRWKA
ncbi:MAG: (2Fe-2S)-binding protein [Methanomassiliicoccales archaeon]